MIYKISQPILIGTNCSYTTTFKTYIWYKKKLWKLGTHSIKITSWIGWLTNLNEFKGTERITTWFEPLSMQLSSPHVILESTKAVMMLMCNFLLISMVPIGCARNKRLPFTERKNVFKAVFYNIKFCRKQNIFTYGV